MCTLWFVSPMERASLVEQSWEFLSKATEVAVAKPGNMQFPVMGVSDCPELSGCNQAEPSPQKGDGKAQVNQGNARIAFQ